jgi:hypothetical protein
VLNKSTKKAVESDEQITIKSPVAIVKDLVTKNVGDEHIIFCEDTSNIVSHPSRRRKTSVHVISVRIGDHCYYRLCDVGDIPNRYTSDVVLNQQARVAHQGGMADCQPGGLVAGNTMAVLDTGAHGGSVDRPMAGCLAVHA